jgi:hypothetical protein
MTDDPHRPTCGRNYVLALQHLFVPHSGTVFLTPQRRRNADRFKSRGWAKRFIPIYFEPGGPLGILPAAFSKVTDTTKGPP